MNFTKIFTLAIFSFVVLAAFASATLTISSVNAPPTISSTAGSFQVNFTISSTEDTNVTFSNSVTDGSVTNVVYSTNSGSIPSNTLKLSVGDIIVVNATLSFSQNSGTIVGQIVADPTGSASNGSVPYSVSITSPSVLVVNRINQPAYTQNGSFTVSNTGSSTLSSILLSSSSSAFTILPTTSISSLNGNGASSSTFSLVPTIGSLRFGDNTVSVTASSGAFSGSTQFTFTKGFCRSGPTVNGNLSISDVDIDTDGDDNNEWKPTDEVSIEVTVENEGDDDVDDVIVEIGLFDDQGFNVIDDMDFESADEEQIELGDIGDGDQEDALFTFRVPADIDTGNYRLAVKAYSDDAGESRECADTASALSNNVYEAISIERESDEERFLVIEDIQLPDQAVCGDTVTGQFEVFNIGDEDQDQVKIEMRSTELRLSEDFEIREDLDQGDSQPFSFTFQVPNNLRDGNYRIGFKALYDYRNGNYREESEDTFYGSLRVLGCTGTGSSGSSDVAIDADLASAAQAGKELVVEATITNTGDAEETFTVDATGYQSWADLGSISKRVMTLAPGQSESVTLHLNVNDDVSGAESFALQVSHDGQLETQEVEVNIQSGSSSSGFSLGGGAMIWIIAGINLVLIILIIVIAVKMSRR